MLPMKDCEEIDEENTRTEEEILGNTVTSDENLILSDNDISTDKFQTKRQIYEMLLIQENKTI